MTNKVSNPMEENTTSDLNEDISQIPEEPSSKKEAPETKPSKKRKVNYQRLAKSIRTWTFTSIVIFFALVLIKILVQEIYDKGYHIQAIRVPQEFELTGYDGVTVAYMILDDVNRMIKKGNRERTVKEIEEFKQTSERNQLQVEVAGIGISPEAISSYIKQAMGVKSKVINGEIVKQDNTLKFFLRISDRPTEVLIQTIDSTGATKAFENIIQRGSEFILKCNYPLILGYYYSSELNDKSIETYHYTIQSQPDQAANAYASLAYQTLMYTTDSTESMNLIRKSLSIDPNNSYTYVMWSFINRIYKGDKSESLLRKAVDLDPTNQFAWVNLGYMLMDEGNDEGAISCFEKCHSLDETYPTVLLPWTELLFLQGKFDEANEKLEKLKYLDPSQGKTLSIAIPLASGNHVQAWVSYRREKESVNVDNLIRGILNLAEKQKKRKQYEVSLKLAEFSQEIDEREFNNSSISTKFIFASLAELYGLKSEKEKFYNSLEKAFDSGFRLLSESSDNEPYKSFSSEDRYKNLLAKYDIK